MSLKTPSVPTSAIAASIIAAGHFSIRIAQRNLHSRERRDRGVLSQHRHIAGIVGIRCLNGLLATAKHIKVRICAFCDGGSYGH